MARPRLNTAPTAEELAAEPCPLERVAAITDFARTGRTLPKPLAALRLLWLRQAFDAEHTTTAIAERLEVSVGRVSQLARRAGVRPRFDRKPAGSARAAAPTAGGPGIQQILRSQP